MIAVIHAHPYPSRSRACAALVAAIGDLPGIDIRSLYTLYPDFDIDVAAEQAAVDRARLVVWLHPLYWYTAPSLLKHWFDVVLTGGWAHGHGGTALKGKECLWVTTTGDTEYRAEGAHGHRFAAFVPVIEQTALYCGMRWLDPFVVHNAHAMDEAALRGEAARLRERLDAWSAAQRAPHAA